MEKPTDKRLPGIASVYGRRQFMRDAAIGLRARGPCWRAGDYYNGGSQVVPVDQRSNGGTWYLLGTYNFNAGTTGNNVYISNDANGWVIMDAVKFVPV
jgi:hypothetical protein